MVAVPIDTESNFSAGSPDVLFEELTRRVPVE